MGLGFFMSIIVGGLAGWAASNIMKAKKTPIADKTAADYGVDVSPRLEVLKTEEPEARKAGEIVGSVDELVEKLKEAGAV